MPPVVRLILDPPAAGTWNMAVDEALLDSAARRGQPTLRIYRWEQATLSLGYFQRADERRGHAASSGCPLVRRSSGGGAIVHDRELTYSYVTPVTHHSLRGAEDLYGIFHETLMDALSHFDTAARICCEPMDLPPARQPFLCFQRRSQGDLLVGDAKVAGSAQRRQKRGLLQHGSILLSRSACAPELPGLADMAGQEIAADPLVDAWLKKLGKRLEVPFEPGELASQERAAARSLAAERFGHARWTLRR